MDVGFEARYLTDAEIDEVYRQELRAVEERELRAAIRAEGDPTYAPGFEVFEQARERMEAHYRGTLAKRARRGLAAAAQQPEGGE